MGKDIEKYQKIHRVKTISYHIGSIENANHCCVKLAMMGLKRNKCQTQNVKLLKFYS